MEMENPKICGNCNGTGYDNKTGFICRYCNGRGVIYNNGDN